MMVNDPQPRNMGPSDNKSIMAQVHSSAWLHIYFQLINKIYIATHKYNTQSSHQTTSPTANVHPIKSKWLKPKHLLVLPQNTITHLVPNVKPL